MDTPATLRSRDATTRLARAHDLLRAREGMLPDRALDVVLAVLRGAPVEPPVAESTLVELRRLLAGSANAPGVDVAGRAFTRLLPPEMRRSLGVFLTPERVADALVRVRPPLDGDSVLDPCCGSGTLLVAAAQAACARGIRIALHGSDVSPRMVSVAEVALQGTAAELSVADALGQDEEARFDLVLTNPPFGTASGSEGRARNGSSAELRFASACLKRLRPGGHLVIVVPKGSLENAVCAVVRQEIDRVASLDAVMHLPPETFGESGTQVATTVLFLTRRRRAARRAASSSVSTKRRVPVAVVRDVGVDVTGRATGEGDLDHVTDALARAVAHAQPDPRVRFVEVSDAYALDEIDHAMRQRSAVRTRRTLGDVVTLAQTGKTPARDRYTDEGAFIVKVGNLTGAGIDWTPRERNFVDPSAVSGTLLLEDGDLLFTSTAHRPKYLALKVDVVTNRPPWARGPLTFVGELMRLRVDADRIDPLSLLCFLRSRVLRDAIQSLARGQTAHLRPRDVLALPLPGGPVPATLLALVREELELRERSARIAEQQRALLDDPDQGWTSPSS